MNYITITGIKKDIGLLNAKPHWVGPALNTFVDQKRIDIIKDKIKKLHFPCKMQVTSETDMDGKHILQDENGNTWSESHFNTSE